ncbi:2'-5' RNA ligase family protein [Solitalea koreensis]|uniref:2'-5' RNA ligase n=1 Tax=Solitalea koreensis TaxID=543615 RepID=A0A521CFA3_9SPHI|nr:2'-5' RNA ligase family protein [Solitalea koreensis]SMO58114.1 2'-5' RNA ligase [Solitalea koreensis]
MARVDLYFIAILPPDEIGSKIIKLKQRFAIEFSAPKGLKILPHITLQMPFKAVSTNEPLLIDSLERFSTHESSFEIRLNRFGFFAGRFSHVVYVHVEENPSLSDLHQHLMTFLRSEAGFSKQATPFHFKPHLTIAHRDLSKEQFEKAWPEFEQAHFEANWTCHSFHLLKHDGKQWQRFREFIFLL